MARGQKLTVLEFCFLPSSLGMVYDQSKTVPRTSQWSEVERSPRLEPFSRLINPAELSSAAEFPAPCSIMSIAAFGLLKTVGVQDPSQGSFLTI